MKLLRRIVAAGLLGLGVAVATPGVMAMDNSALERAEFREHKASYGLVYRLPAEVTVQLETTVLPRLRERLVKLGLENEARTFNLPHVSVVHIHSADPTTPAKMLKALPRVPAVIDLTLKGYSNTEAAQGTGAPWWFDLGVVKSGPGYVEMLSYNTVATAALTPLRDGPLPRCTGPVYAKMGDADRELTRTVGVNGVNVLKDGRETASHNPHATLMYSMTPYDARLQAAMKEVADEMNRMFPEGNDTRFKEVAIVEIGFMGNVLREYYRISLENGVAWDVVNGKRVARPK